MRPPSERTTSKISFEISVFRSGICTMAIGKGARQSADSFLRFFANDPGQLDF
jgi:hypothetical protein